MASLAFYTRFLFRRFRDDGWRGGGLLARADEVIE
jgi:hypothetical protein